MIITVYNIKESWIFTHENKPSKQLFNTILNNSTTSTVTAQFIEHPNNFNIKIRMSDIDVFSYKWNLIKLNDDVFYKVTDIQILQEKSSSTTNTIINVSAEIDLYLSYVCNLFDENTTNTTSVFFIQKHLNRYYYANNTTYVNFEQQFYLKNKHENLDDIGINLAKAVDIYNNSNYNNNITGLSSPLMNYSTGSSYVYALCKFSKNAADFQNIFSTSIVSNEQLPNLGMINIGTTWKQYNLTYDPTNGPNILATTLTVPWYYFFIYVPSDVCIDYIVYPCPIENAFIYKNASFSKIYTGNPDDINFSLGDGYLVAANTASVLSTTSDNNLWTNFAMWLVNPQNLYYFYTSIINNGFTQFFNIYDVEPYLIQYCKFRIRGAGEDSFVDLTFFNNVNPNTFVSTLYSFVINQNHPVTQITNISATLLNQYLQQNNVMQPYGYNDINDTYFCLNWKASYPSMSNNWSNYLMNNLNEYHTALNIAHFGLQQAQANIAFGALGGLFGGISLKSALGTTAGITSAIFNEEMQQQSYNYLKTGKREDMSRVSNERLATNNNVISYYNYLLTFVFEYPVKYEQILATNYCILNGYVLKRWNQFNYWNNRQYCNYVKINFFCDCLLSGLIVSYKKQIDQMMVDGIRIWNNDSYGQGWSTPTLQLNQLLYPTNQYYNVENNQNNNEINYLNNNE